MNITAKKIEILTPFITEKRLARMRTVLENRTRFLALILEDIYQPHNASAVLRSAECFGIQDIHIIEKENRYRVNPDIALGASQWLTIQRNNNTLETFSQLKSEGYQIAALTLQEDTIPLETFELTQKTALCLGTEETGLSQAAIEHADIHLKIPMYGFTQSFNISVTAAMCLYDLTQKLRQSTFAWQLSNPEKETLLLNWMVSSIPGGEKISQNVKT